MEFHLVKAGERPLFAVPSSPARLRSAALLCYPVHTWKKRLVRSAVRGASRAGLLRWLFPAVSVPLPGISEEEFEAWLAALRENLAEPRLQPMLVWPGDPARGRIYLHLLGADGIAKAFCKLSLDSRNDGPRPRPFPGGVRCGQLIAVARAS